MSLEKRVGRFETTTYDGGHPVWTQILDREREVEMRSLSLADVRDLHYALSEIIRCHPSG